LILIRKRPKHLHGMVAETEVVAAFGPGPEKAR
jgi:hypothetical protein